MADLNSALLSAVSGLRNSGPMPLMGPLNGFRWPDTPLTTNELFAFLEAHNQQDNKAVRELAITLAEWDFAKNPPWDQPIMTDPRTVQRRRRIYDLLDLPQPVVDRLDHIAPVSAMRPTVISEKWNPWYDSDRQSRWSFYWPHYRDYLLHKRGWPADSVAALDQATTDIVGRISDPASEHQYQSKGLVVGYVQSGKTANFTGVIAKAIDAGYRLIIVMTGTIELLRSQTQRRLDRELVGRENLVRGIKSEASTDFDYAGDDDWLNKNFVEHGEDFEAKGYPVIKRLTLLNDDYMRLKHGLTSMELHRSDPGKPFYDPANLKTADVRLVVVKKNDKVLQKLADDLAPLKQALNELPALIIDDESDLASINTRNPRKSPERTAINKAITGLLERLPRAQLVMYTATPFANFFVDPEDASDIFPKNFVIALDRPAQYMGVADFHDVDWNSEDDKNDPATSNEVAYIRRVGPPPDDDSTNSDDERRQEIRAAIDAFLLAGAIKLYREQHHSVRYRHHTMMIHEATKTAEHSKMAGLVREVWKEASFSSPEALDRLQQLWEQDFEPVCRARAGEFPVPGSFDELIEPLGMALSRITAVGDAVMVVNSEIEAEKYALDFDRDSVWRILIGGAKLSRGFTVEGLTVSFYTRKALQGDTMMQAGRWFGFRPGYRDLVRLFIRRDPHDADKRVDLYEAFEGLMRDEMAFRERLREYEDILEPWQVPPIVSQHLPYLRPAAPNKMFNAIVHTMGDSGRLKDYYGPADDDRGRRANYEALLPLLAAATAERTFVSARSRHEPELRSYFKARVGTVDGEAFIEALTALRWHPNALKVVDPVINFYRDRVRRGQIEDMLVVWPTLTKGADRTLPGLGERQIITRMRRRDRSDFSGSDPKHRAALERISGMTTKVDDPVADQLRHPRGHRGALLVYVTAEPPEAAVAENLDPTNLVVLTSLVAPATATPAGKPVIEWTVKGPKGEATVDISATKGKPIRPPGL
ncbi:Z1 domain-containing protein [Actinoplanes hulinensis]|uniref:Z1 domain-containing protein n=1 Tax=Actinoplanes hulinensis TaxID=1144547 RepID=A0ABS7BEH0_9ACTN|nr:Z1 domain-containing protein [Actinoplanes hulinensis]MBW6439255.1 Z1 domain-containing protein [Actinoplanes hulinensis]MBW6439266.1 Z1 domain-containing protein [Actinoplanes hulinensis]